MLHEVSVFAFEAFIPHKPLPRTTALAGPRHTMEGSSPTSSYHIEEQYELSDTKL
jgi:hypothetical protein